MDFSLESELASALSGQWNEAVASSGLTALFTEFRIGSIIPDFLGVTFAGDLGEIRWGGLTHFDCHVLAALLNKGRLSCQEIAASLFAREITVTQSLRRLAARGVARGHTDASFSIRKKNFPKRVEIIAVEAKLHRWIEAIKQAETYLLFSNRSFVALPSTTIEKTFLPIVDRCQLTGIGLISVEPRSLSIVVPALPHNPTSPEWIWAMSRAFTSHRQFVTSMQGISEMPLAMLADDSAQSAD